MISDCDWEVRTLLKNLFFYTKMKCFFKKERKLGQVKSHWDMSSQDGMAPVEISFWTLNFLDPKYFWAKILFGPKIFGPNILLNPKFVWTNFFCTQNHYGPNICFDWWFIGSLFFGHTFFRTNDVTNFEYKMLLRMEFDSGIGPTCVVISLLHLSIVLH